MKSKILQNSNTKENIKPSSNSKESVTRLSKNQTIKSTNQSQETVFKYFTELKKKSKYK